MIGIAVTFAVEGGGPVLVPFAIGLALFVIAGALTDLVERTGLLKVPVRTALARAAGCRARPGAPRSRISGSASRCSASSARPSSAPSASPSSSPAQTISIRRYDLHFDGVTNRQGPNYRELAAHFTVRRNGEVDRRDGAVQAHLPVARHRARPKSALMTRGFGQLYLSLGDPNPDGSIAVRLYHKPLVLLIWLGAVVMVIGGALSLSDRRLRVGAPKPATRQGRDAAGGVGAHALVAAHRCMHRCALLLARRHAALRAVQPDEVLPDPTLEARARALSKELRCMVCQNQSIDDSDAPLARDLRILVRERLKAGDSDQQVLDFLVARYGEFVLLRPRLHWHTALLWLGPPATAAGRRARAFPGRAAPQAARPDRRGEARWRKSHRRREGAIGAARGCARAVIAPRSDRST